MKISSKYKKFDDALRENCGSYYNREIATLTVEEMRRAQRSIDLSWQALSTFPSMVARQEYHLLKSDVNRKLQARGGFHGG